MSCTSRGRRVNSESIAVGGKVDSLVRDAGRLRDFIVRG